MFSSDCNASSMALDPSSCRRESASFAFHSRNRRREENKKIQTIKHPIHLAICLTAPKARLSSGPRRANKTTKINVGTCGMMHRAVTRPRTTTWRMYAHSGSYSTRSLLLEVRPDLKACIAVFLQYKCGPHLRNDSYFARGSTLILSPPLNTGCNIYIYSI